MTDEPTSDPFRVRVQRPWEPLRIDLGHTLFDTEVPAVDAQALVVEFTPSEDLFSFHGPRAFYCSEPITNPLLGLNRLKEWPAYRARLTDREFLYHAHPNPDYRVPCYTYVDIVTPDHHGKRDRRAAAVVSNLGPHPRDWWPAIRLRNQFLLSKRVHVYGSTWGWDQYRMPGRLRRGPPRNHRGPLETVSFSDRPKIEALSSYYAAVCLENNTEPYYFTEKFSGAVLAGCVPIYHAHPTVRDGLLQGARWVDPADFRWDVRATLDHALSVDRIEWARANMAWFHQPAVRATGYTQVWERIAAILRREATT